MSAQGADPSTISAMAKRARIETPRIVVAQPDDSAVLKSMIETFGTSWGSAQWQRAFNDGDVSKQHIEDIIKIGEMRHKTVTQTANDIWDTFNLPQKVADRNRPRSCNF